MTFTWVGNDKWKEMRIWYVPRDGYGDYFPKGSKYVCFDGQYLVGEFSTRTQALLAFLKKQRSVPNVMLRDYKGIAEEHKEI